MLGFFLLETAVADPCQSSPGRFWPIAAVCGWENETGAVSLGGAVPAMTMRYAHLSPDTCLMRASRVACRLRESFDTCGGRKEKPLKFARKIRGLACCIWWSRGDLNPRPPGLRYRFYMLSHLY